MSRPVDSSAPPAGSNGVLLFAQIEGGQPPRIFPPFWGKAAYERFQIPIYLDELQSLRESGVIELTPEFLALACSLDVLSRTRPGIDFEELGSTLFSSIDKLEILFRNHHLRADLTAVRYCGIEVMPLMVWLARALHPGYDVVHHGRVGQVSRRGEGITRCYQASSYAFSSTEELIEWTATSAISGQGVFFSRGESDERVDLMGNPLTLFSLPAFHEGMTRRGFRLIPLRSSALSYDNLVECEEIFFLAHRLDERERHEVADLYSRLKGAGGVPIDWEQQASVETLRPSGSSRPKASGFRRLASNPSPDPILNFSDPVLFEGFRESLALAGRDPGRFTAIEELAPPFEHEIGFCWTRALPGFSDRSDTEEKSDRSDLILLEDGVPLGPLHSSHAAIRTQGGGRSSHWNTHLYFSTSDNSDPNENGRRYTLAQRDGGSRP